MSESSRDQLLTLKGTSIGLDFADSNENYRFHFYPYMWPRKPFSVYSQLLSQTGFGAIPDFFQTGLANLVPQNVLHRVWFSAIPDFWQTGPFLIVVPARSGLGVIRIKDFDSASFGRRLLRYRERVGTYGQSEMGFFSDATDSAELLRQSDGADRPVG